MRDGEGSMMAFLRCFTHLHPLRLRYFLSLSLFFLPFTILILPKIQQEDGDKLLDISPKGLDDVDPEPDADDLKENSSSASDEDDECAPQKLTRAQRKRLRQKKLKETASYRRKIIGPQLPSPSGGDLEDKPPKIPHSAADELVDAMGKPGNTPTRRNQTKLKQRRMAKKLAREREKSSNMENCNEDGCPHSTDGSLT
ncbi:uncharacterized protein LOC117917761 isoform X1 [Vitis riparia]|uniref:uncharacterized protein LOC117917761 isoform X1 n=1 Tax=Vitis riparia TaxID=96939 RepID=UPI00155B0634|nr:uncharacterized protein LOC117917761 isoform X1 [Vitis riparia]